MRTEQEFINDIKATKHVFELDLLLSYAKRDYSLCPDVLGRIIDCKFNRELEIFYANNNTEQ